MIKTTKIRILIADDFKPLRETIRLYLARAADMEVVGEAPDLDDALEQAKALQPNVILMNDYLPPINSAHAAEVFRAQGILAAILAISLSPEAGLVWHSMRHGVDGFMYKDEIDRFLIEAIRTVFRGERYLSPGVREIYGDVHE